ncbi:MAG: DUF4252 domain-containing protein [Bacteroidetes bacterium]|nr:MAG: DUF4252 domain-containing protein [Bacteroidota bacterium]
MKFASIFTSCLFFLLPLMGQAQEDAISKYFNKYLDDERFTVVYVSGKMFQWFKDMEIDLNDEQAEALLEVVEDLQGLRILTTEGPHAKAVYEEALATIPTSEYETLMTVREGTRESVQFLVKENGDKQIGELLLIVGGEDEEFVLLSFIGHIDLNDVGKLQRAFKEAKQKEQNQGQGGQY